MSSKHRQKCSTEGASHVILTNLISHEWETYGKGGNDNSRQGGNKHHTD